MKKKLTAIPLNLEVGERTDRFSMLHALDKACEYKCVHTPFICDRSTSSSLIIRKTSKHISSIRKSFP